MEDGLGGGFGGDDGANIVIFEERHETGEVALAGESWEGVGKAGVVGLTMVELTYSRVMTVGRHCPKVEPKEVASSRNL